MSFVPRPLGARTLDLFISHKNPFWEFTAEVVRTKDQFDFLVAEMARHHELIEMVTFSKNEKCFVFNNARFFDTLLCCDRLKVVSLPNNMFVDRHAGSVAHFLKNSYSCISFDISFNSMTEKGLAILTDALATNPVLLNFKITHNRIKNEGMKNMAEILRANRILETVDLSSNLFDATGEDFLYEGLKANRTLRVLTYSHIQNRKQPITKRLHENNLLWREKFLRDLKNEQTGKWNRSKLMFIGQGRAGKTSTVRRLLHKGFEEAQDSTVGASVQQTQTSTTQDQKWRQVTEEDAAYLGKGMRTDIAAATIAARNLMAGGDNKRAAKQAELKKKHLEQEEALRRQRLAQAKRNRAANGGGGAFAYAEDFNADDNQYDVHAQEMQDELLAQQLQRQELDMYGNYAKQQETDEEMIRRLQQEDTKEKAEDENAKLYADAIFKSARETKDSITFSLWDYGGQTVFYALHHLFLTKYGIYILCVNMVEILTEPETAKNYLLFWLNSVKLHAPTAPVLLVGTYLDELGKVQVMAVDRFIRDNFIEKFPQIICFQKNSVFYPVDNKNNKGLNYLRFDVERVSRKQEFVTAEVSLKWLFCLDKMMVERDTGGEQPSWLALNRVREVAERVNLRSQEELEKMLNLFHELGVLVRLTGTEELRNLVTLDPQWLIDGLCRIIRDQKLHGLSEEELLRAGLKQEVDLLYKKGIASLDVMKYLWKDDKWKEHVDFFLDLMKYMVLISDWDFRDEKMFVIPSLLTPKYEDTDLFKDTTEEPAMLKDVSVKKDTALVKDKETGEESEIKASDTDEEQNEEVLEEPEEREISTLTEYCVFDFSKVFLPLGVFQRLVCLCVSYSTTVGESGNRVTEPDLYERHAKIWMGNDTILYLEQRGDEIWLSVENLATAPTCFKAVNSMLNKLNADLMGSGLKWDISFKTVRKTVRQEKGKEPLITEAHERDVKEAKARKKNMEPWFEKKETKKKTKAQDLINLESFINAF